MTSQPIRCPKCDQPPTQVGDFWICPKHGPVPEQTPFIPLRIFLSYGHDSNEELVRRIKVDLGKRGHDVWFDKTEIKAGDDWRRSITEGITKSNKFVSFLSKHSTRDPGVCRDEIAIAIGVKGGNIQTILVESEQEVQPPVNIGHIQWLDMHDWREQCDFAREDWGAWYQDRLAEIVRVVESDESRRFAGEIETLNFHLRPIKSEARIYDLLKKGFIGRDWLFKDVETWRQSANRDSRLFWITGDPGVGKSAFAAQLTHTRGDTVIAAQFCDWKMNDHSNAPRVVRSIAFQLASRLPDYRKLIKDLPEIAHLDQKNSDELFDYLLANPLRLVIGGGRERYLIVIDALDEAGEAGRNPLVEMLARNAQRLPDWLGLVITSRPESAVKTPLQGLNPFVLDTRTEANRADLRDYLQQKLAPKLHDRPNADRLLGQILEKSEGVFLYVEHFCDDVQQNHLSLDRPEQFPHGLGGIYCQWFQRQFPDEVQYEKTIEPMLGAILAAREPLPVEILQKLFGWRETELRKWLRKLGSLFPDTKEADAEVIKPYHKSLADWLTDEAKAGSHFVSVQEGRQSLSQFCCGEYCDNRASVSGYTTKHLLWYLIDESQWELVRQVMHDSVFVRKMLHLVGLHQVLNGLERTLAEFVHDEETFTVYISSTFADMKHERRALHRVVFPRLDQLCQTIGHRFEAIDLMWGISREAALDHRIMRIVINELRRACTNSSPPIFVILLGNNYGWRPMPEEMSEEEFRKLEQAIAGDPNTDPVLAKATLDVWYRRDDNSIRPVYVLQSRLRDLGDGKNYGRDNEGRDTQDWLDAQGVLWSIINQAFPANDLSNRFGTTLDDYRRRVADDPAARLPSIVRFQASATEQEIWRGLIGAANGRRHVLAIFREIANVVEFSEKAQGFVGADQKPLRELKAKLAEHIGARNVAEFKQALLRRSINEINEPIVDVTTEHLAEMCDRIYASLEGIIRQQIDEYWRLEIERDKHQRFSLERAPEGSFVGRDHERQRIAAYLRSDSCQPLVVHGESGCGKTALLAQAAQDAAREREPVVRFIGVTPCSSDIRSLLSSLCQELRCRNPRPDALPGDVRELTRELHEHFKAATVEQPLIVFLDALDQLGDAVNGRLLYWLPYALPPHVKLVMSCLSDRDSGDPLGQPFASLKRRELAEENFIHLGALSPDESRTVLFDRWLLQAGRTLSRPQQHSILERLRCLSDACRQPLYLKLLFEEARLWRSYDVVPFVGADTHSLIVRFFDRVSLRNNNGALLECVLGYLMESRFGLSESELTNILSDDEYAIDFAARRPSHVPSLDFRMASLRSMVRVLISSFTPYLKHWRVHGVMVVTFFQRSISETAAVWVRRNAERRSLRHRALATYFLGQAFHEKPDGSLIPNVRALMEYVYQVAQESEFE